MSKTKAMTGAEASAEAMRQINPDVCPCISYHTTDRDSHEIFTIWLADGIVDTEIIRVESEHSAMSASVGG